MKPGTRLVSAVSATQVVVIRPAGGKINVTCGGAAMTEPGDVQDRRAGDTADAPNGVLLGKRYEDADSGLEVLCTRAGGGPLAVDGRELSLKEAKPLPASD